MYIIGQGFIKKEKPLNPNEGLLLLFDLIILIYLIGMTYLVGGLALVISLAFCILFPTEGDEEG